MGHARSRKNGLRIAADENGGLVVYEEESDTGHLLNPTVAAVFELADGTRSEDEIARLLTQRMGLPVDREVVVLALQELDRAGLLEVVGSAASEPRVSRRALLARLALGAGAGVLLPVVHSVLDVTHAAEGTGQRLSTTLPPSTTDLVTELPELPPSSPSSR
jgi:hypothetical protein